MVNCVQTGCKSRSCHKSREQLEKEKRNGKITFHRLPKEETARKIWMRYLGTDEENLPKNPNLCSLHFKKQAFDRLSMNCIRLKYGAVPEEQFTEKYGALPKKKFEKHVKKNSRNSPQDFQFVDWLEESVSNSMSSAEETDKSSQKTPEKELMKVIVLEKSSSNECGSMSSAVLESTLQETNKPAKMSPDDMEVMEILENPKPNKCAIEKLHNTFSGLKNSGIIIKMQDASTSVSPARDLNSPKSVRLSELLKERERKHKHQVLLLKRKNERLQRKLKSLESMHH